MSVSETSERYVARDCRRDAFAYWGVFDATQGAHVDVFRTFTGADYAARLLNNGLATIDHHAVAGCRVVAAK